MQTSLGRANCRPAVSDGRLLKCVEGTPAAARSCRCNRYLIGIEMNFSKRPEFPSGITSGARPTIQSWFIQRVWERRVARGDGDR